MRRAAFLPLVLAAALGCALVADVPTQEPPVVAQYLTRTARCVGEHRVVEYVDAAGAPYGTLVLWRRCAEPAATANTLNPDPDLDRMEDERNANDE